MSLMAKKKRLIYVVVIPFVLLTTFVFIKEKVYAIPTDCYCKGCNGY